MSIASNRFIILEIYDLCNISWMVKHLKFVDDTI